MIKSKKIAIVLVAFLSPCHSSPLFSTEARYIAFYAKSIRLIFLFLSFYFFFLCPSQKAPEKKKKKNYYYFFFVIPLKPLRLNSND